MCNPNHTNGVIPLVVCHGCRAEPGQLKGGNSAAAMEAEEEAEEEEDIVYARALGRGRRQL